VQTCLDQATLTVYSELAAVYVTEVDLDACKLSGKPLQIAIHFASDELDHPSIYRNSFGAVDLNPHAFVPRSPLRAVQRTSWRLDSMPAWRIPFIR
jgi:hypothetical protein